MRNKPDPRIEHPQDAILRVTCAAICGSDLHLLHGLVPDTRVGSTFGHEIVGVVEEVGPQADGVAKGDRLMVPFNISCGGCYYCERGLTACCENTNPSSDVGVRRLRLLAHDRRIRRRAGGVRARPVRGDRRR